ncbi:hypothetical protein [Sphingobacterium hungaricum]|nr:hypothetical protein [Sphingobacterium hungaricum]
MSTQAIKIRAYKIGIFSSFILSCLFFASCKENMQNEIIDDGTRLVLTIEGIEDEGQATIDKDASTSVHPHFSKQTMALADEASVESFGEFNAVTSLQQDFYSNNQSELTKVSAVRPGNLNNVAKQAAVTALTTGVKYRVLVYDNSSSSTVPVSSTLGTAGTALNIPVEKGKNYYWVVYSFNDDTDPGTPSDGLLPTDQRDLLHAVGIPITIPGTVGDGQEIKVPLKIRLRHKLSRIKVEVTAANYPGIITAISANLGANNYFRAGTLDLKTGGLTANSTNTVMPSTAITFNPVTNNAVKTATYYTMPVTSLANFQVRINSMTISTTGGPKSFSTARTFTWPMIANSESSSYTARVDFKPLPNPVNFKILSVGSAPYAIMDHPYSGIYHALKSASNFGPTGIIPTLNTDWALTSRPGVAGELTDLNTGSYKLLYVGYAYILTTAEATAITTFLNNGGTVIYAVENPGSAGEASLLSTYAGTTSYTSWGLLANTTTNAVLNGKFGDARSKQVGNDAGAGFVITSPNLSLIDVLATNSTNAAQVAMFKSKTRKFYWVGDGGFDVYNSSYNVPGSANGANSFPFLLTSTGAPYIGAWYTPTPGTPTSVANSTVLMNIIGQALLDAQ